MMNYTCEPGLSRGSSFVILLLIENSGRGADKVFVSRGMEAEECRQGWTDQSDADGGLGCIRVVVPTKSLSAKEWRTGSTNEDN
jgi:hypothetical protein